MLVRGGIELLTADQWEALNGLFPPESLSVDTSQELELISIKAVYVIERLNDVFEPCGIGWRYAHSPCVAFDLKNDGQKITIEVAFQYYLNAIRMRGAQKDCSTTIRITHRRQLEIPTRSSGKSE